MRENIKLLRLLSGEELIGVCEKYATGWIVKYPMIVVTNIGQTAESVQVTFAPFCPAADTDEFEFNSVYVAFVAPVFDGLRARYMSVMEFDKMPEPVKPEPKKRTPRKKADQPTMSFTKA